MIRFLSICFLIVSVVTPMHLSGWAGPDGTFPNLNTSGPINVGSDTQTKSGALWTRFIGSTGGMWSNNMLAVSVSSSTNPLTTGLGLKALFGGKIGASSYCGVAGTNCYIASTSKATNSLGQFIDTPDYQSEWFSVAAGSNKFVPFTMNVDESLVYVESADSTSTTSVSFLDGSTRNNIGYGIDTFGTQKQGYSWVKFPTGVRVDRALNDTYADLFRVTVWKINPSARQDFPTFNTINQTVEIPSGAVVPFYNPPNPNADGCPSGWKISDGTSGTVDMRGNFLAGTKAGFPTSGGSPTATLIVENLPAHTHSLTMITTGNAEMGTGSSWAHDSSWTTTKPLTGLPTNGPGTQDDVASFSIIPSYIALKYCQKI
jgi:hypothetical protein